MKRSIRSLVLAGATAILLSGTMNTLAQRGGDPAERRQITIESYRERLAITNDDEWKVFLPRIEKVYDARQALQAFSTQGFGRGGGRGGRGGRGGDNADGGGRRGGLGGPQNPTVEALAQAIEANASTDDLKQKLAKWRDEKKAKEADLAKAQDDLKQLLSVKQEAIALTMGLVH